MKIVIDIPQGLKNDIENENWTALTCAEMKNALMRSTPLPKGIEVLDKIRAELVQMMCVVNNDYAEGHNYGLRKAIQTIDKHKAESEG